MKFYHYIKLVIFIAFATLIFVYNKELLEYLHYLVSSLMIAFGVENIIVKIIKDKKKCFKDLWFAYGFAELLIGLVMIISIRDYTSICVIWGVWSILREAIELHEIASGELKGIPAILSGVESIVAIVFSIMLIMEPGEHHAHVHVYLLIPELLVSGFVPVLDELLDKYRKE